MKSEKYYPSKKFFWKIIFLTSAAVLLILIVLSTTIYINSQHILLEKENELNKKVFDQVKINIDMMDTMASNLCKSLYTNSDVTALMYENDEDPVGETSKIYKIAGSALSANPYIHSITIYNGNRGHFFNAGHSLFFDDKQITEIIDGKSLVPKLKSVSRTVEQIVNEKVQLEHVFSYFMYENSGSSEKLDGAIAVNIRIDWFLDNIKQINMIDKDRGETVFVLNNNNRFIELENTNDKMKEWLKREYDKNRDKTISYDYVGNFQSEYNSVDYLITYSYIKSMDITIIKVQKISEVYRSLNNLRVSIAIITSVFLVAALLVFAGISRKIYKPVRKLVQLVYSNNNSDSEIKSCPDEISYLNNFYRSTMEKLDSYKEEKYLHKDIMKTYWLNRLLTESYSIESQKSGDIFEEGRFCISPGDSFVVCILSIDNYKSFVQEYDSKDRELLRFAAINISSEIIGSKYKNEGMDMKDDHVALLIGIPDEEECSQENLISLIRKAQNYIKQYFKLSVSASVSNKTGDIREISALYNKASDYMAYRLKEGYSCIITQEYIDTIKCSENNISNIKELQILLMDSLKSADFNGIQEVMKRIFNEISLLEYDSILVCLVSNTGFINNAIEHLNASGLKLKHFDFNSVCKDIMEKETLEEIYNVMMDRLQDIFENKTEDAEQSKNSYIVNAVRDFIENNYQDSSLSLTGISTVMNISSRRLSKIFKDEMQTFIPDYINEVRLRKAAELLETTSLNVNEIISKLGIDNETYFYKIFKNKFGITPKEYAFKRIVNMTQK